MEGTEKKVCVWGGEEEERGEVMECVCLHSQRMTRSLPSVYITQRELVEMCRVCL